MTRPVPIPFSPRRRALPLAALLVALALAGCTGGGSGNESSSDSNGAEEVTVEVPAGGESRFLVDMQQGQRINYSWSATRTVFFDLHYDQGSGPTTQHSGSVDADQGVYYATRDALHGWSWRNDGDEPVTVTLRIEGEYTRVDNDPSGSGDGA